ncbi:MAG: Ig-like domain-containing protein, partial [Candidatus Eisenbacteria bacterium]
MTASYAFDEGSGFTTADGTGNGNAGNLTNGPTWVAGKYGTALSFNASDDGNDANDPRVVLGRTINIPNLPFTFSAWVNPAGFTDWRAIISKRDNSSAANMRMDMGLSGGTGRVYVATGSTFRSFAYAPPINVWTHLALVAEATGTKLYVNGILQQTLTAITLGTGTNANTVIGGTGEGAGGDNDPYKGLLDDLRLYDRVLTALEIQTDMITPAGVPDTEPPTVALTAPAAGAVSGTAVTVSATASDNVVVAGVQFKLDGVDLGAEDTTAPYSITWNSVLAADGAHTLTAVARDAAGNDTTSADVAVTVSNPAVLTITQPANGSTIGGTSVSVAYTTTGNLSQVSHVHFVLDANPQVMDITMDGVYQLNNVPAGPHVLNGFFVRADHSKILGTDATPVSFTTTAPDTIAPTVSITAPAAASTLSGSATITADAFDGIGVVGVQFRVGALNITPEDTTAPYSVSFNTTTVPNGTHLLTAVARDAAGNQTTSASVSVTVTNTNVTAATYAFDEGAGTTTADGSGNGNTGNLANGPTWVAGKYGTALSFNASDDGNDANDPRVVLGRTINIPNLPFTFSAWVNPAGFTDWRAIISKRDNSSAANMRMDMGLSGGTGRVYVATGSTFRSFAYAPPINVWTHLALVAEATGTKLYVNGILQQTLTAITLGTGTNANTVIGGTGEGAGGDNDPYKGLLDDLRLYDRVLTALEIQTDMITPAGVPDTEPPTVALTAPAAGAVSGTAVTVSATASDNVVVAGVQFKLDGVDLGAEDTTAPYSLVWNSLLTSDGAHVLTAAARDAAGSSATSADVAVTVSNPAILTITQPTSGAVISGTTVNVSYTTSGNLAAVDHVHFVLDTNPEVMDVTVDGSYQFINVPAGAHALRGFFVNADHIKISGSDTPITNFVTTVADTIAPTVSITSPAATSTLSGTVTITADADDNAGVLGVQFRVGAVNLIPEDTTAPFSVSFNTTMYPNGPYLLTAVARDAAGNQTTSSSVSITVSNLNPNDPAIVGQWSTPFAWPNVAVHATMMSDGNILSWDDHTNASGSNVWNPTTNAFTPAPYTPANLFCAGHTALADGRILVNGGHVGAYAGITSALLFTPIVNTWTAVASMAYARWYPTTITLADGRVLTVSGAINCPDCRLPGGPDPGIAEIPEVYDPVANTWTQLPGAVKNLPIYPHLFMLPDGRVIATSTQEDAIDTSVLDINAQTWTTVDPRVIDGGSTVMYLPGKFMKSGSAINPDYPALPADALTHLLDMTTTPTTWRQTASMAFPRTQHNLTILPDGNVLVTGGARTSNVYDEAGAVFEAELWSPSTETYTTLAGNQVPRMYHSTALLLPDGRVVSMGGGRFGPSHLDGEIYSPPYLFRGPRPTITAAPAIIEYGANFTVTTPNAAGIATVSLIRLGSVTHAIDSEQRFLPLTFQQAGGGLAVQAPTNPNIAPPGTYYLFIVDTNGVPSVAAFVRFPSPSEDAVPPSAPLNLVATGTLESVSLTWTASTDNLSVAAYDVHRSASASFTPSAANKVGATSLTSFSEAGLLAGTYYYKVLARDPAGNTSQPSNEATVTVAGDTERPSMPLGLSANIVSFSRIDLSWSASTDNVGVTGYRVIRDGAQIATTTLPAYSNTGLSPATAYSYTIEAIDAAGNISFPSAPLGATTPGAPPLAANLKASYAFDEGAGPTTADYSGNGNVGTLANGPTWVAGKYGTAL